jgi:hypothetical protein
MRSLYESSCDSLIRSGTSAVAAFAAMDADLDNAQAALQWAQTHDGETAASLAMAIGSHLALTGPGWRSAHLIRLTLHERSAPAASCRSWASAVMKGSRVRCRLGDRRYRPGTRR